MSQRNTLENKKQRRLAKQIRKDSTTIPVRKILWIKTTNKYGNAQYRAY